MRWKERLREDASEERGENGGTMDGRKGKEG